MNWRRSDSAAPATFDRIIGARSGDGQPICNRTLQHAAGVTIGYTLRLATHAAAATLTAMAAKATAPKILVVDDDVRLRDLLSRYLDRAGLPGRHAPRRARARQEAAARPAASRRARPDAARRGRARRVPAAARRRRDGADHHADREGRGRRSHRRARDGRRRLSAEAVQSARARRAHPRGAAPAHASGSRRARRRPTAGCRSVRSRSISPRARCANGETTTT